MRAGSRDGPFSCPDLALVIDAAVFHSNQKRRRHPMKLLKVAAFHTAVAAAIVTQPALAQDWKKFGIDKDVPGACSYESISKKDYKGRTLNIITHAVPVIGEPTALH